MTTRRPRCARDEALPPSGRQCIFAPVSWGRCSLDIVAVAAAVVVAFTGANRSRSRRQWQFGGWSRARGCCPGLSVQLFYPAEDHNHRESTHNCAVKGVFSDSMARWPNSGI